MLATEKRKSIDLLVEEFWKQGYLTLSRKFGTYLPEPSRVGVFEVDIIARYKKSYAIGITLTEDDFKDSRLIQKINYLASRHTKFSNKRVMLYIGITNDRYKTAKDIIDSVDSKFKKNIKLVQIVEQPVPSSVNPKKQGSFFS